jgi:cytochrome c553
MNLFAPRAALTLAWLFLLTTVRADEPGSWWAYGFFGPPAPGEKATLNLTPAQGLRSNEPVEEQTRPRHATGTERTHSLLEIRNRLDVVDWFPEDHPAMPRVVQHGSPSLGNKAYGCALCHMPHGQGRPENAPVNGLPPAYFLRQLQDFREGRRSSSEPRKGNALLMVALAQAMTEEEMHAAADYYSRVPARPWIRVVETDLVPKIKPTGARMFLPTEEGRSEAIGHRIVEVPENVEQVELANPHVGFVAYVPRGSIRRGETLVTAGRATVVGGETLPAQTVACVTCHGPDLRGLNDSPPIAGRSPSYLVRQLNDIKQGTRKSPLAQTMLPVVANLSPDDMVDIAAYVSSRPPAP